METFTSTWSDAAATSLGFFWMALWAFALGYAISGMIQVFVTRQRMKESMGEAGAKSVGIATFFGFISSSCSFAALATTRSLFTKGAGIIPALAFLLASTNLVIELGIVIAIFLSWQFVVGEYVGGILLILLMWLLVKLTRPHALIEHAREHARKEEGTDDETAAGDWKQLIRSREGWRKVAVRYVMEWRMVWKDIVIGFTVAGAIAAFVPRTFFETLFVGSASGSPAFWEILLQAVVGPLAAFVTFIGSMGNIPLAAVLYHNGVSFAGVIAFIFSDLIVFPVLRIQAKYYGWKMALYILGVFFLALVAVSVLMHYGIDLAGFIPHSAEGQRVADRRFFAIDYTFFLNIAAIAVTALFLWWRRRSGHSDGEAMGAEPLMEKILFWVAMLSFVWLGGGLLVGLFK